MEANSQKTIHTFKPIYPQITKINLYQIWDIAANLKPKMTVSVTVWWGIKDIFVHCKDEELDLPSLYWIPKLHKCPFKQRYIAGSAKCSTKPLSKLLTCILSAVKTRLQNYCDTSYSRGGVNQMWILKNSKDLLEYIQSRSLSSCNSIKTFDFSTLYTTIPHSKLKDKLRELVQLYFIKKNDQRRYKYLVLGRDRFYFVKNHWFYQKVLGNWYHQHARVFDRQHICYLWWTCFSTDSRHTDGYKLCSSSCWLVPLFLWGRLHTGASQEKWKETSLIL